MTRNFKGDNMFLQFKKEKNADYGASDCGSDHRNIWTWILFLSAYPDAPALGTRLPGPLSSPHISTQPAACSPKDGPTPAVGRHCLPLPRFPMHSLHELQCFRVRYHGGRKGFWEEGGVCWDPACSVQLNRLKVLPLHCPKPPVFRPYGCRIFSFFWSWWNYWMVDLTCMHLGWRSETNQKKKRTEE